MVQKSESKIVVVIFQSIKENGAGGFGEFGYELAAKLHEIGKDVCLYTINKGPFETKFPSKAVLPFARYCLWLINRLVDVKILKHLSGYKLQEYLFDKFLSLRKIEADVLFTTFPLLPSSLKKISKNVKRIVLIPQNPDEFYINELCIAEAKKYSLPFANDAYTDPWRIDRQQKTLPYLNEVVSISQITHHSYAAFKGKRSLIPYYVHRDFAAGTGTATKPSEKFVFLFVAHIVLLKGLHQLLEAWQQFKNNANAELWIVGGIEEDYKKSLQDHFPSGNVVWMGYRSDIRDLILTSKAVIIPSLIDNEPQTAVEALSLKRPVIISTGCGSSDWLGKFVPEATYEVGDVAALAYKIGNVLEDYDCFYDKYLELYKYVLDKHDQMGDFVSKVMLD